MKFGTFSAMPRDRKAMTQVPNEFDSQTVHSSSSAIWNDHMHTHWHRIDVCMRSRCSFIEKGASIEFANSFLTAFSYGLARTQKWFMWFACLCGSACMCWNKYILHHWNRGRPHDSRKNSEKSQQNNGITPRCLKFQRNLKQMVVVRSPHLPLSSMAVAIAFLLFPIPII